MKSMTGEEILVHNVEVCIVHFPCLQNVAVA